MFSLFKRAPVAPKPSLADQAVSFVGLHDVLKAESIADMREWRGRLASNIEAETKALAAVDAYLAREDAILEFGTVKALKQASADIEIAFNEIELDLHASAADEIEKHLEDRKKGTERRPKRASSKLTMAAAE